MSTTSRLLQHALPLVRTYGFTRDALSRSVLVLPQDEAHAEPLLDTAVSSLFGQGDDARRTLIDAWIREGLRTMRYVPGVERHRFEGDGSGVNVDSLRKATARDLLRARLEYNEPVIRYLPEAFSLLASPSSGLPPLDPIPAFKHITSIANEACILTGDPSIQLDWYARRGSLAAVYAAAELHQLTSPHTAIAFLDSLLDTTSKLKSSIEEVELYSSYIFKSWRGIVKSSGVFLSQPRHASPNSPSLPYKTNPAPNFFVEHSVVLNASLKDAYTILGTAVGHERVCRLSKLCTAFELQGRDTIELPVPAFPEGVELKDLAVRTAEYTYTGESENVDEGSKTKRTVSRQHFTMEEVVPILFGLVKSRVVLTGTMSWNNSALSTPSSESSLDKEYYALYESISNTGIMVWKLRTFSCEQGDPARTRVTERIEGWAPALLRAIVQREAVKSHRAHMDLYSMLFDTIDPTNRTRLTMLTTSIFNQFSQPAAQPYDSRYYSVLTRRFDEKKK